MTEVVSGIMRAAAGCLSLLALMAPLLWGCQKQPSAKPSESATPPQVQVPSDPTRRVWQKEKAKVFAAVAKCSLTPAEAIRQLEQRRKELTPSVKDGRKLGFSPAKVKQIASKAGCAAA